MDGTKVVTKVNGGVETIRHNVRDIVVCALVNAAEISVNTLLEGSEVTSLLDGGLVLVIYDVAGGNQVHVAGEHHEQGSGRTKQSVYCLFHIFHSFNRS